MARIPNIRLVVGPRGSHDVKAYNLDTGEQIRNIYAIQFSADANESPVVKVSITAEIQIEYEGPADVEPLVVNRTRSEE